MSNIEIKAGGSEFVKTRYREKWKKEKEIKEWLKGSNVVPTDNEKEYADLVIAKISEQYRARISQDGVDAYADEISKQIDYECERLGDIVRWAENNKRGHKLNKDIPVDYKTKEMVKDIVKNTVLYYGPLTPLMDDPRVTEIIVQRYNRIVAEVDGIIIETDIQFYSERHLLTVIERICQECGRQINSSQPIVDATMLKTGSRVNATIPPIAIDGPMMNIRKFVKYDIDLPGLHRRGTISKYAMYFLIKAVQSKMNIFIIGGTGSGKTTMLNALARYIDPSEQIVTIEDTAELDLGLANVRREITRRGTATTKYMDVSASVLVKDAMRKRPDRIILGETRDGSIVDVLDAMSTGHAGSMSTAHADTPDVFFSTRLPMLFSKNESGSQYSRKDVALYAQSAIDLVVCVSRMPGGERKLTYISQVCGLTADYERVVLKDIFKYDSHKKEAVWTGYMPETIVQKMEYNGVLFSPEKAGFIETVPEAAMPGAPDVSEIEKSTMPADAGTDTASNNNLNGTEADSLNADTEAPDSREKTDNAEKNDGVAVSDMNTNTDIGAAENDGATAEEDEED